MAYAKFVFVTVLYACSTVQTPIGLLQTVKHDLNFTFTSVSVLVRHNFIAA